MYDDISINKNNTDFAIIIKVSEISQLMSLIKDNFDEIIVWDCYCNWQKFISEQTENRQFFTFKKNQAIQQEGFYLDFSPYKDNEVSIISGLSFNDSGKITKDNIISILN